ARAVFGALRVALLLRPRTGDLPSGQRRLRPSSRAPQRTETPPMRANLKFAALTAGLASCLTTLPAFGQVPMEYGIDAGATFGFGDVSSVEIALPASRFRVGFPQSPRITVEPVAGLAYTKIEDTDGVLI